MHQNTDNSLYPDSGEYPKKKSRAGRMILTVLGIFLILCILAAVLIPVAIGYARKSYTAQANSTAKLCFLTAQTAIEEKLQTDEIPERTYIVTNVAGWEDNLATFDTLDFVYAIDAAIRNADQGYYYYFFVVEDEEVTYAAVKSIEHRNILGSFPEVSPNPRKIISHNGTEMDIRNGDIDFLYLYQAARTDIFSEGSTS